MATEQIQYLQAIFREGSLNRAAKSLGLSQSTMSKSLQSLERELGVSLFLRVQGRLMPTRQGYVVLDMVQKISGLQEQMVKCLNIFRSERGDSITMGFPFYWNYASFAPVLENFHRLYPSCQIHPVEYSISQLRGMLEAGKLQAALVPENTSQGLGFRCLSLGKLEVLLAVPPQKGAQKMEGGFSAVKIQHASRYGFLMPDESSILFPFVTSYFRQQCFTPNILFESSSPDCRLSAVNAGLGCTLILESFANLAGDAVLFSLTPPCCVSFSLVLTGQPPISPELKLLAELFCRYVLSEGTIYSPEREDFP